MTTDPNPQALLDVDQAATFLNVSRATIYKILATGELASFRVGRRRKIKRSAIDEFVSRAEAEPYRPISRRDAER